MRKSVRMGRREDDVDEEERKIEAKLLP